MYMCIYIYIYIYINSRSPCLHSSASTILMLRDLLKSQWFLHHLEHKSPKRHESSTDISHVKCSEMLFTVYYAMNGYTCCERDGKSEFCTYI